MVSVGEDRYALRLNPVYAEPHILISDSDPDSMDDDFAPDTKWLPAKRKSTSHHSWTPSSHPLQSEASVPMTVDQQAETPLSQDNRDHSPEQACTAAAIDTDSPDTTGAQPDSFTGTQSGQRQQHSGVQEKVQHGSDPNMHPGQDCETAAAKSASDDYVSQQGAALLTGLCQYYNMSPAAQLGAVAGFLWHLAASPSMFQVLQETGVMQYGRRLM